MASTSQKGALPAVSFLMRLAKVLPWAERQMRLGGSTRRLKKSGGYLPIFRYKLVDNLTSGTGTSATATLTFQESDGTWLDGTSPDDDAELYADSSTFSSGHIASGSYVLVWRNPATGLLNLLQGPCATT